MTPEITASILERFPEEARLGLLVLMEKHKDEPFMAHLIKELSLERPQYLDLFARGMTHLPVPAQGGRPSIAAYFLLLSEIEGLPDEARTFALQASAYAQGANEHDQWYRAFSLDSRHIFKETVWPVLLGFPESSSG